MIGGGGRREDGRREDGLQVAEIYFIYGSFYGSDFGVKCRRCSLDVSTAAATAGVPLLMLTACTAQKLESVLEPFDILKPAFDELMFKEETDNAGLVPKGCIPAFNQAG